MNVGLLGRKVGMMRIFSPEGDAIPVTVVDVSGNRVSQLKTIAVDGYCAVQVAFGERRRSRLAKPQLGHFSKAAVEGAAFVREFPVGEAILADAKFVLGSIISASIFSQGQAVDVQGVTKGKGFTGTIKRYNFASGRASHGNSRSHNVPGSIGMAQDPGRVFPGKRMSGHMGDDTQTSQNLQIVRVDAERGLLMIRGPVPGAANGFLIVRGAVKAKSAGGAK